MLSRSNSTGTPLSKARHSHRPDTERSAYSHRGGQASISDPVHQPQIQLKVQSEHTRQHAHHTGTGHDVWSKRQQAEAAAVEAYHRARVMNESNPQECRPTPSKPQRRRSRASGRTEGGHFEEARLGRRKSGSTKPRNEGNGFSKQRGSPQRSSGLRSVAISEPSEGETVITRRRSVIPPGSDYTVQDSSSSVVPSGRRQSRSEYTNGSPLPRPSHGPQCSSQRPPRGPTGNNHGYSDATSAFSNFNSALGTTVSNTPTRLERSSHADRDLIDRARDQAFRDFQPKNIRERKSTLFASLNKLRSNEAQKRNYTAFDASLPPFNHANEGAALPDALPPLSQIPIYTVPVREKKSRNFTESLKGRFKKAFGKTDRVPTGLPAQHVEGRTFDFSTIPTASSDNVPTNESDSFHTADHNHLVVSNTRVDSAVSKHTADTTIKSRLTSSTNSTVAGTWSTRSEVKDTGFVGEQWQLKRSDSVSTLRRAKSFFGRPIQNRLRKPSKAQLSGSDESSGLYSALQERIHPSDSASQAVTNDDTLTSRTSSALATLPSQQRHSLTVGSNKRSAAATVRAVTPDMGAYMLNVPSPVAEVLSPDAVQADDAASAKKSHASETPRSQLKRRHAIKAPTPSKEQLTRRMQRSDQRWQGPLDEMSPSELPTIGRGIGEDNPYELRSLSRSLQPPPIATNALPHHARVAAEIMGIDDRAAVVMSPSVYSRNTDEASPRQDSPIETMGTMVTITGREVRSYSISPQKKPERTDKPAPASGEWRRWLSDEWKDLGGKAPMENFSLPRNLIKDPTPTPNSQISTGDTPRVGSSSHNDRPDSSSPPLIVPPMDALPKRPRPQTSRSSFMNDRYPMIDTGRSSSDARKVCSRGSSRSSSAEPTKQIADVLNSRDGVGSTPEDTRPTSVIRKARAVSKYRSMIGLGTTVQIDGDDGNKMPKQDLTSDFTSTIETDKPTQTAITNTATVFTRPKSALDLRANYKNRYTGKTHSIPINRTNPSDPFSNRPVTHPASSPLHILEDTTIRNISAGPYASSPSPSGLPSRLASSGADKENSSPIPSSPAPPPSSGGLPALSSSEWLAAGGGGKSKERVRMVGAGKGGSSPGQRMVTGWLEGRTRSKEGTPAYV